MLCFGDFLKICSFEHPPAPCALHQNPTNSFENFRFLTVLILDSLKINGKYSGRYFSDFHCLDFRFVLVPVKICSKVQVQTNLSTASMFVVFIELHHPIPYCIKLTNQSASHCITSHHVTAQHLQSIAAFTLFNIPCFEPNF